MSRCYVCDHPDRATRLYGKIHLCVWHAPPQPKPESVKPIPPPLPRPTPYWSPIAHQCISWEKCGFPTAFGDAKWCDKHNCGPGKRCECEKTS